MKSVLLDRSTISLPDNEIEALWSGLDQHTSYETTDHDQILQRCYEADVVFTNKVVFDKKCLSQLPHLKFIGILATGTNNVDLDAAKELDITVKNVSGYSTQSVAQHVIGSMIALAQGHHFYKSDEQHWPNSPTFCRHSYDGFQIAGKTLGLIGYGSIGKEVATLAKAFQMKILIAESFIAPSSEKQRVPLPEVLSQSDFVTLHCPLSDFTKNLVNTAFLRQMKSTAFLINTARGPIVNELDLAVALKNNIIAGAALDVLNQEPPSKDNPLLNLNHKKLLITPHIAWASLESQKKLIELARLNVDDFLKNHS
tara:strand:- start:9806 stop:10741 length:936 start_codon:yes stop_codon:yes gene_type:complete